MEGGYGPAKIEVMGPGYTGSDIKSELVYFMKSKSVWILHPN